MRSSAIHDLISSHFSLTTQEKSLKQSSQPQYKVEIRWTKQDLVDEGIIAKKSKSGRGFWQLSGSFISTDIHADEVTGKIYSEGTVYVVKVNRFERDNSARRACLDHYGYFCSVCGFSFENTYGPLGKNQIHVHHIIPISSIGHSYQLDPISHLVPLCPNCHHMAHRKDPPFSIDELKKMIINSK